MTNCFEENHLEKIFFVIRLRHYSSVLNAENNFIQNNQLIEQLNINGKDKIRDLSLDRSLIQWNKLFQTFTSYISSNLSPELIDLSDTNLIKYISQKEYIRDQLRHLNDITKNLSIFEGIYSMLNQLFYKYILPISKSNKESGDKPTKIVEKSILKRRSVICSGEIMDKDSTILNREIHNMISNLDNNNIKVAFRKLMKDNKYLKKSLIEKSVESDGFRERWINSEKTLTNAQTELNTLKKCAQTKHVKWLSKSAKLCNGLSLKSRDKHPEIHMQQIRLNQKNTSSEISIYRDRIDKLKEKIYVADETIQKQRLEIEKLNQKINQQNQKYDRAVNDHMFTQQEMEKYLLTVNDESLFYQLETSLITTRNKLHDMCRSDVSDKALVLFPKSQSYSIAEIPERHVRLDRQVKSEHLERIINESRVIDSLVNYCADLLKKSLDKQHQLTTEIQNIQQKISKPYLHREASIQAQDNLIEWAINIENYLLDKSQTKRNSEVDTNSAFSKCKHILTSSTNRKKIKKLDENIVNELMLDSNTNNIGGKKPRLEIGYFPVISQFTISSNHWDSINRLVQRPTVILDDSVQTH